MAWRQYFEGHDCRKPVKKLSRSLIEPNYDHGNSQSSTNISRKK